MEISFCGYDPEKNIASMRGWKDKNLTWCFDDRILPPSVWFSFLSVIEESLSQWQNVCGVKFSFLQDSKKANLIFEFKDIDRPGGILAYTEVPDPMENQKRLSFDLNENWSTLNFADPANLYRLDIRRVVLHEVGHVLGIPHLEAGNLMQVNYSWAINSLQPGDIAEAVRLFGSPKLT